MAAALLLASATAVRAHEDPPGCNETGAAINVGIFRDANATIPLTGAVSPCEIIYYRAVLTKVAPQVPGDTVCAFSGGQFDFKTPNGAVTVVSNPVPCVGATVGSVSESCVAGVDQITSQVIQYQVNPADVSGGLISALSTYGIAGGVSGVAHDGATNTPGVTQSTPKQTSVLSCNDNNVCTIDNCDPALHGLDACSHTPVNCDDSNACTADGCDPASGCFHNQVNCNDGDACTIDACVPATGCTHTPVNCNDSNACTNDACNPATGCTHSAVNCDDGSACTIDACVPATGCTHSQVNCNDGNACTADSCNPATGCVHQDTSSSCNDNNQCTTDSCDPATGCVHTPINCNDNNVCTDDACDPQAGCTHTFDPTNDPSCAPAICRTPGFWGTHTAAAQIVLTHVGGCMEVCGEVINSVAAGNASSTTEAICVSPRGDQRLQLVRQLTAMALNCGMSEFGSDCGDPSSGLGELFADCNDACLGNPSDRSIGDCISDIDCFNNGGAPDPTTGICGSNPAGSCHERALPDFIPQASADPGPCSTSRKNQCTVVPPGESSALGFCTNGGVINTATAETCP